ncbi:UNVERIFIED_CONTAM: hypothetical protein Sradi_4928400 [Sesamum radiatum]|uniref:Uncharacterized protein n=1 Tax=Sesamum radiatum TaxID=300843 RepID=A0AAW2MD22_SESRA
MPEARPLIHVPVEPLKALAHCPFAEWGMDIVGPFPIAQGQSRKWVEAEQVKSILTLM